jgi:hypothetical protein
MMPAPAQSALLPSEPQGFRRLWRTIKQVFHEVMGAMFAVLAFGWLNMAFRAWTRDATPWLFPCGQFLSPLSPDIVVK